MKMTPHEGQITRELFNHATETFKRHNLDQRAGIAILTLLSCWTAVWSGLPLDSYLQMIRELYGELKKDLPPMSAPPMNRPKAGVS